VTADIVIVDYGLGNLRSVQKAFEHVGHAADVSADPARVATATKLVLPGVGAFRDAIDRLRETGLADAVCDHVADGLPFLGICLGLQLLFTKSAEDGCHAGLDLLPGAVVGFPPGRGVKVPHMGWNTLRLNPACPLFAGLPADPAVYFVHGYYAVPTVESDVAATCDYPTPVCAAVWRGNLFATQFHPEKSQDVGLRMLKNFAEV
jgi:glutamine amidotransferase